MTVRGQKHDVCIRNLRLGFLSRLILTTSSLRSCGVRAILCIWAVLSVVADRVWYL